MCHFIFFVFFFCYPLFFFFSFYPCQHLFTLLLAPQHYTAITLFVLHSLYFTYSVPFRVECWEPVLFSYIPFTHLYAAIFLYSKKIKHFVVIITIKTTHEKLEEYPLVLFLVSTPVTSQPWTHSSECCSHNTLLLFRPHSPYSPPL